MSEMNSGGGSSYEQDPFDQATEQYVAQELRHLDSELAHISEDVTAAQCYMVAGEHESERANVCRRRAERIKVWSTSLGGGIVATTVLMNFVEAPRGPLFAGLIGSSVAYVALKVRASGIMYTARNHQANADKLAYDLHPLYLQGIVGTLPDWARESFQSQGYPYPTYPESPLERDGENLKW